MSEQTIAAGLDKPEPCLYCGGTSVALIEQPGHGDRLWAATCQTCQAAGPMALGPVQALTLWNHRPLVQKLERKLRREAREWRAAAEEGAENGGVWPV